MKLIYMNSNIYADLDKKNNKKNPKFEVCDHIRTLKYKNIFSKICMPKNIFVIAKVKTTVPSTYFISDCKGEEVVGRFNKKELQKTDQKEFKLEK